MEHFILLDRTGSMGPFWAEAVSSVNAYVETLCEQAGDSVQIEEIEHRITLAVFDFYGASLCFDVLRQSVPIERWIPFGKNEAPPRGMTPLLDAVHRVVSMAEEADSERTAIIVMTDGMENYSTEMRREDVRNIIDSAQSRNWQVIFLGAQFDAWSEASTLGVDADQTMSFASGHYSDAMIGTAMSSGTYAATGQVMGFSQDLRNLVEEDEITGDK